MLLKLLQILFFLKIYLCEARFYKDLFVTVSLMAFFSRTFFFLFLVLLMLGAAAEDRSFDVIVLGS